MLNTYFWTPLRKKRRVQQRVRAQQQTVQRLRARIIPNSLIL